MITLSFKDYACVFRTLESVHINHLCVRAVLEGKVDGVVYVDAWPEPRVFYVWHPYGMSMVFGDPAALTRWTDFWTYLGRHAQSEEKDEWLQAWPEALHRPIGAFCGFGSSEIKTAEQMRGKVERHTRVNFQFDPAQFSPMGPDEVERWGRGRIVRTSVAEYEGLSGTVIPRFFWRDREAFLRDGVGFSLVVEGVVAATAFSAFIHDAELEIGIETAAAFRGQGCASLVCRRLIGYCLKRGLEPVWSCRLSNTGSMKLAEKIGFRPTVRIPYYRFHGRGSCGDAAAALVSRQ